MPNNPFNPIAAKTRLRVNGTLCVYLVSRRLHSSSARVSAVLSEAEIKRRCSVPVDWQPMSGAPSNWSALLTLVREPHFFDPQTNVFAGTQVLEQCFVGDNCNLAFCRLDAMRDSCIGSASMVRFDSVNGN